MMLFLSFGHTADEDPAWLDLLTPLNTANTPLPAPQRGRPRLCEARDTKLLSSGTQLFPQENSPAAGAAQAAHYRGSLPGNDLPMHIHELAGASRESWLNTQLRVLAAGFPGGRKKGKGKGTEGEGKKIKKKKRHDCKRCCL